MLGATYAAYALLLTRGAALPYVGVIAGLCFAAWEVRGAILALADGSAYSVALVGTGIVLTSFTAQLLGHALHERFQAPPLLMHGFVAAPVLEFVSLLFRLGALPELYAEVLAEVASVRAEAGERSASSSGAGGR